VSTHTAGMRLTGNACLNVSAHMPRPIPNAGAKSPAIGTTRIESRCASTGVRLTEPLPTASLARSEIGCTNPRIGPAPDVALHCLTLNYRLITITGVVPVDGHAAGAFVDLFVDLAISGTSWHEHPRLATHSPVPAPGTGELLSRWLAKAALPKVR
jgi:hypothetical protein